MAKTGLLATRQTLMPLSTTLPDLVFQQALRDFQPPLDGERREGFTRQLQERLHVQRQLNFPALSNRLLLDPPRPTPATPTPADMR